MRIRTALRAAQVSTILFLISASTLVQGQAAAAETALADPIQSRQLRTSQATILRPPDLIEELSHRMQDSPDDWRLQNRLAVEYSKRGENGLALPLLDSAATMAPQNPAIYYNLAVVYVRLDRPAEALSTIKRSLALDPDNANAQRVSCDIRLVLKRYEESAKCYRALSGTNARDATFYSSYSLALAYSGSAKLALKAAEDGIRAYPDEPIIINCYGIAYFMRKDFRRSVQQFQRVVRLDPGYSTARLNLAIAALMADDRTTAYDQYRILRDSDPSTAQQVKMAIDRKFVVTADGGRNSRSSLR